MENVESESQRLLSESALRVPNVDTIVEAHLERANRAFARTYVRKANSPYGRAFLYNKNWSFAQSAELATRASIFMLVFATPLILSLHRSETSFFYENEMFNSSAIVMFVYTLYLSVGDTIIFAIDGMLGTISAAAAAMVMFAIFPHGCQEEVSPGLWWFGLVAGVLFVTSTLVLNFSTLAQVFALSNFVWHWMAFMTGVDHWPDTIIFGVHIRLYGFEGILTACSGCMLAMLSICLPYPMLALTKACDVAEDIVTCIGESWDTSIEFYCNAVRADYKQSKLRQEMSEISKYIGSLQGYVDSSWWEAVLIPKWRRTSIHLFHLNKVTKEVFDRLMHVIVRSVGREEFDEQHEKVMKTCQPYIDKVIMTAKTLLERCMKAANNGGVEDAAEEAELETLMGKVKAGMRDLTQKFLGAKEDLGLLGSITETLIDEHVFAFEVCVFGRLACELAANFINDSRARRGEEGGKLLDPPSKEWPIVSAVKKVFDPKVVRESEHLNFALRNTLSILLGFTIGYNGYHKMIREHNAGISGTAAVLLSKYGGSALTKNMNRLMGVVVGELAGELIYALLGWCDWWGVASLMVCVFLWSLTMLFTYYNSPRLGPITCLMAAFGTQELLKGCSEEKVNPLETFHDVINCVVSIFIMMFVDSAFSLGNPSKKASGVLAEAWEQLVKDVLEVFSAEKETVHEDSGAITALIGNASFLNQEANEEPRYWKTPWKFDLFNRALECASGVRLNLTCIVYAVADEEGRTKEDTKEDWFQKLLQAEAFKDIRQGMETMMEQIKVLSKVFAHEEVSPMEELKDEELCKRPEELLNGGIKRLMADAGKDSDIMAKKDPSTLSTMEQDGAAQLAFVISCIRSLMQDMQDFKFEVLAAGPA
uniref:DUF2421 domain-containing protein n=1 Tax=Alexandrium monilatum TaxID=311494 RepID=A0A7S4SBP9_9DINO|mmetsp:Transcript_111402/g.355472  ORF Transcript_111402/g.355472 Transcript_111402/m.355472 type:complete len:878 (+) Transcript_111402:68-2701(+)